MLVTLFSKNEIQGISFKDICQSVFDQVITIEKFRICTVGRIVNRENQNLFPKEGNKVNYIQCSCSSLSLNLSRFTLINECLLSLFFNFKCFFSDRKTYGRFETHIICNINNQFLFYLNSFQTVIFTFALRPQCLSCGAESLWISYFLKLRSF